MFLEAAEGGAGVLRRLQAEPDALATAATEALRIIHVDPATGEDRPEACVRGCYRCLLSYGNQPVHEQIDRRRAVGHLLRLSRSHVERASAPTSEPSAPAPGQAANPRAQQLLELLAERDLRPPQELDAQIVGYDGVVDIVYRQNGLTTAVIFADTESPPDTATLALVTGWNVIQVRGDTDLENVVAANPSVFGAQGVV
jgi:hypothetical protein